MGAEFILKGGVPLLYGPLDHIGRLKVGELTFRLRITAKSDHDIAAQSDASSRHTQTVEFLDYETNDGDHEFDHVPYEDDRFAWAAGLFLGATATQLRVESDATVFVLIHGEQALVQHEQLRQTDTASMAGPIWCPVANMKAERPMDRAAWRSSAAVSISPLAPSSIAVDLPGDLATTIRFRLSVTTAAHTAL